MEGSGEGKDVTWSGKVESEGEREERGESRGRAGCTNQSRRSGCYVGSV